MSAEREAGFAALQNGNAAEAIPYLERAISSAPDDFQALLQLGAAYGQVGRHADAVRTVLQVVTLQPSNAAARYSLAAAYANAGHKEYALTAAQQALLLQPENTQARALIARLSGTPASPAGTVMGSMPTGQPGAPASYGEPTQTFPGQPAEPTVYRQPTAPAPYGQPQVPPTPSQSPYGQATPPYGAPGGAQPQASPGSYQGQGAAAYGGSPLATPYTPPARPGFAQPPDKFDMKQAITDWMRVIREPNAFFREHVERTGYNAPLSFLVTFGIASSICGVITGLIQLMLYPGSLTAILFQITLGIGGGVIAPLGGAFLWGGVLHVVGRLFGNRQSYERTFRVAAYSRAPLLLFSLLSAFILPFVLPAPNLNFNSIGTNAATVGQITPVQFTEPSSSAGPAVPATGRAGATNPFEDPKFMKSMGGLGVSSGIGILGLIWVWCLQSIGLQHAQETSVGGAIGTIFVALLIPMLLFGIAIGGIVLLAVGVAGASRSAPGFQNLLSLMPSDLAVWRGL